MSCPTPDPLAELVAAAQGGDMKARDQVVAKCLPLVRRIAAEYGRPDLIADLVQAGVIGASGRKPQGLIRAIDRFRAGNGTKFTTFAAYWVRCAMRREFSRLKDSIGLTHRVRERAAIARRAARQVQQEQGSNEEPSAIDVLIAARVESRERLTLAAVERALAPKPRAVGVLALEHTGTGGESATIAELDAQRAAVELRERVASLPKAQRTVISARFGLDGGAPATFTAIAKRLGRSDDWARRTLARAVATLRQELG